ncbi:hypothetical protein BD413DRAFT_272328 [Trametes elegans]|nr:hypothetical protein BD413DRAFT_272328 [Trametes elegans]
MSTPGGSHSDTLPPITETFGAILLGTFVGLILYGLNVHQTIRYLRNFPHDVQRLKSMVIIVFIVDTFHSVFGVHMCYYYLVMNAFHEDALLDGVWSIRLLAPFTMMMVLVVHGFYVRRLYKIGPQFKAVVIVALCLMLGEAASTMVITVETYMIPTFSEWTRHGWLTAIPFGFSLAADVVLSSTLILILHTSRTGMRRTDSIINVLIVYTINTGLLTRQSLDHRTSSTLRSICPPQNPQLETCPGAACAGR